jgi:type IV secretory pathway TraG/TraD family ATPase VirD4
LTTFDDQELKDFFRGSLAQRYIGDRDSSGDILATLINEVAFYERIQHDSSNFSFFEWAESNDSRSIYFPLFERDLEIYKPFYSLAFDLILKGLLSNESRNVNTLILIDELGALQRLAPLSRVLAEGRKFRTTGVFGAQSVSQIEKTYGEHDFATITENIWSKLILNCEGKTAEWAAAVLDQQERVDLNRNSSSSLGSASIQAGNASFSMPSVSGSKGVSESIRETQTVLPSELAALPPLTGYLKIKGQNPAKVKVEYQDYPKRSQRFVAATETKIIQP